MTDIQNDEVWQSYFYPGRNVLINKLGIHDFEALKEAEATITFKKLLDLNEKPLILKGDKNDLLNLHRYVFDEIYPFAGEYRKVNMRKEKGTFLFINDDISIDQYLDELFVKATEQLKKCHSKFDFAQILGYMYTNLIYCHPFREGNGRVIREFIREFSLIKSKEIGLEKLELDWRLVDKDELNEYIEVAHMFPAATGVLFNNALVKEENMIKKS